MRISDMTLALLAWSGDEGARKALRDWKALDTFSYPPIEIQAYGSVTLPYQVGLVWEQDTIDEFTDKAIAKCHGGHHVPKEEPTLPSLL